MKLPIYLIGEDSLALASLRQQMEKEPAVFIEPRVHNYADAFDHLRTKSGPIVAVIDLNRDEERAFAVAAEIKFKLPNVHLVITSPDDNPQTLLRAMRSGAEEYLTQPFFARSRCRTGQDHCGFVEQRRGGLNHPCNESCLEFGGWK
jgi:pilus assembly protein CpaE